MKLSGWLRAPCPFTPPTAAAALDERVILPLMGLRPGATALGAAGLVLSDEVQAEIAAAHRAFPAPF